MKGGLEDFHCPLLVIMHNNDGQLLGNGGGDGMEAALNSLRSHFVLHFSRGWTTRRSLRPKAVSLGSS